MTTIESVNTLQELLLSNHVSVQQIGGNDGELIVVLRQYRFYKNLCIELYEASRTQAGKIKNPLTIINPLDLVLRTDDPDELRFFSAIGRFQNNPTAGKGHSDIDALRAIIKNPKQLRFFYHNTDFSENIAAGSIEQVTIGDTINDLDLVINKKAGVYEINLKIPMPDRVYEVIDLKPLYDYFLLHNGTIHLLGNANFLKPVQFFKKNPQGLRIPEAKYKDFVQNILAKLENSIHVIHSYVPVATSTQIEEQGFDKPLEKLIYLSDLGIYVMINPVVKYGTVEIPVLTKRNIYSIDHAGNMFAVERNEHAETKFIALLLRQHADFEEQLQTDLHYFYLHKDRFLDEDWFLNAFDEWESHGITILGFNQLKGNQLNRSKAKVSIHVISGIDWFNAEINVRFGKKNATLKQLQRSVRNKSKFVHLDDGTLGILPQEWLEKFFKYFTIGEILEDTLVIPKINFSEVSKLFEESELEEVKHELTLYESKFADFDHIEEVASPPGFNGTLRDYQKHGLDWLNFLDGLNFGGCLADDMGLGKTIQVIAFILLQKQHGAKNSNLIVAPTSLLFNWRAEIEKFAPSIKVYTVHGAGRLKSTDVFDQYEVILTSYGTLVSDISYLRNYHFNYVFLDESQNIKNIDSQRYQAARLLRSRNRVVITGTPIENNTLDLYGQFSFACPGLLGNKEYFRDVYSIPIDKFQNRKRAVELQKKVAPFILRRTKTQVASELPEKTEMKLYCEMGPAQRAIYDKHEKEFRDFISSTGEDEIGKNSMHVLRGLTRLRQICNSPVLLQDEKLGEDASSKIEMLMEQVENKTIYHKILIFSQFVSMLNLIQQQLKQRGIEYEYLTGQTKDREAVVNRFQSNEKVRIFLISLKAGGVGLNLTGADYIYLVDPWWNPAVENQAIDRSHRIGQKKNVMAVRLICPDTIEDKILKLQESKKILSDQLIKTDAAILKAITKSDLLEMLAPPQ